MRFYEAALTPWRMLSCVARPPATNCCRRAGLGNQFVQAACFIGEGRTRRIGFFHHRCVLHHLIHLVDCRVDLGKANGLLTGRRGNRIHVVIDRCDEPFDGLQRIARIAHQLYPAFYLGPIIW